MRVSRREFLRLSGLISAGLPLSLSACAPQASEAPTPPITPAATRLLEPPAVVATPRSPVGLRDPALHALSRLSYGPQPGAVERLRGTDWTTFVQQQLHPDEIDDTALEARLADFTTLQMSAAELFERFPQGGMPGPRLIIRELQMASLLRAVFSKRQLLEVMVDFWSNYLNIYIGKTQVKWLKTSDDRDVIRPHALGKFRDLLLASARSPAMLVYLDNAASAAAGARRGINENYARKLLELHTVGVDGGYTQADIPTVARLLTGWTVTSKRDAAPGAFGFRPRCHDLTAKRLDFLGLEWPAGGGEAEGVELLTALAAHPRTAERLAGRLCATFVDDAPPADLVRSAAQVYLANDTAIRPVLEHIFAAPAFQTALPKLKLPLRLLVSALRAVGASIEPTQASGLNMPLLDWLRDLGQPLFEWSAPNGYPQSGAAWTGAGGMLSRWNFGFALVENRIRGVVMPAMALDDPAASAEQLVAQTATALGLTLSAEDQAVLVEYLRADTAAEAPLPAAARRQRLPELAGLLLASPQFQLY